MFGGFAPPQLTEAEIKEMEYAANFTIQSSIATAVLLYLSPFAIDAIYKVL
ncbi:mitochondrial outer membrane translocase complex, subunit Tom5 [Plectosphaerella plurivora]|uniref:Mitochondrial outer membrane translocase complex, subunit Tom5 n=2 Tax=Plectosphaerella TaxID=40657 RepID=A0A9P8V8D6_9PEZI|nr:mitochondrial outer membrane translocase complex, subunit Tom5 [Plectosphaerella plurivora]KAH7377029.1 mitochondrial outer membrane translocase complex, subunit Tom5 [Plectosphaerella cucumerina]